MTAPNVRHIEFLGSEVDVFRVRKYLLTRWFCRTGLFYGLYLLVNLLRRSMGLLKLIEIYFFMSFSKQWWNNNDEFISEFIYLYIVIKYARWT